MAKKQAASGGKKPAAQTTANKPAAQKAAAPKNRFAGAAGARAAGRPIRRRNNQASLSQAGSTTTRDHLLKIDPSVGVKVRLTYPNWNAAKPMIFRPYPAWNPDVWSEENRLELDPYRLSTEPFDFSDIVRNYPAVNFLGEGDNATSFLLFDRLWEESQYDPAHNPYLLLFSAVRRAVKDHSHTEWLPLVDSAKGKGAILPPPCDLYFMQGYVLHNGKEAYFGGKTAPLGLGKDDPAVIIVLKNTAGERLMDLLNARNEEWGGDPDDYENSMVAGDPVDPANGRFVSIINPKAGSDSPDENVALTVDDAGVASASSRSDFQGYEVNIQKHPVIDGKTYKNIEPSLEKFWSRVQQRIVFFDHVLHVPTNEEQALYIVRALRGFRKAIEYGWRDHSEYFTDDVKKVLSNATQVPLGAAQVGGDAETSATTMGADDFFGDAFSDETDDVDDAADGYEEGVDDDPEDDYDQSEPAYEEGEGEEEEEYDEEGEGEDDPEAEYDEEGEEEGDDDADADAEYEEEGEEEGAGDDDADADAEYEDYDPEAVLEGDDEPDDADAKAEADRQAALAAAKDRSAARSRSSKPAASKAGAKKPAAKSGGKSAASKAGAKKPATAKGAQAAKGPRAAKK